MSDTTPHDWPSFWSALTPQEAAEALRAAPRVANAWVHTGRDVWCRFGFRDVVSYSVASAWPDRDGPGFLWSVTHPIHSDADSLDAAKQAADDALRAAGWVLL